MVSNTHVKDFESSNVQHTNEISTALLQGNNTLDFKSEIMFSFSVLDPMDELIRACTNKPKKTTKSDALSSIQTTG